MNFILFIPTLNAGERWLEVVNAINEQSVLPVKKVVIDSGSTDGTITLPSLIDFEIIQVPKETFDHGGTRQMAVEHFPEADIYLFLTQDAVPADTHAFENLIRIFEENPKIGAAYGRQLPHKGAKALEAHARLFNYPAHSQIRSIASAKQYGIKTASCSNSFAAYRRSAFDKAGGFPSGTILGEDVVAAGRILLNGWQLAYVADATVHHSHSYTVTEEFKRYFDIGVFHATNSWIFTHFGSANAEGLKYVHSEILYVLKHAFLSLPKALASIAAKWLGYKMGLHYKRLPTSWRRKCSMHKNYWRH